MSDDQPVPSTASVLRARSMNGPVMWLIAIGILLGGLGLFASGIAALHRSGNREVVAKVAGPFMGGRFGGPGPGGFGGRGLGGFGRGGGYGGSMRGAMQCAMGGPGGPTTCTGAGWGGAGSGTLATPTAIAPPASAPAPKAKAKAQGK